MQEFLGQSKVFAGHCPQYMGMVQLAAQLREVLQWQGINAPHHDDDSTVSGLGWSV